MWLCLSLSSCLIYSLFPFFSFCHTFGFCFISFVGLSGTTQCCLFSVFFLRSRDTYLNLAAYVQVVLCHFIYNIKILQLYTFISLINIVFIHFIYTYGKNSTLHHSQCCLNNFKEMQSVVCTYPCSYHFQCSSFLCVNPYFHVITFILKKKNCLLLPLSFNMSCTVSLLVVLSAFL